MSHYKQALHHSGGAPPGFAFNTKGVHTSFGGIVTGNGILAYLLSASNVNQITVYTINMMYWRSLASNDRDHNFTTNEFTKVITVVSTRGVLSCIYIIYIYTIYRLYIYNTVYAGRQRDGLRSFTSGSTFHFHRQCPSFMYLYTVISSNRLILSVDTNYLPIWQYGHLWWPTNEKLKTGERYWYCIVSPPDNIEQLPSWSEQSRAEHK